MTQEPFELLPSAKYSFKLKDVTNLNTVRMYRLSCGSSLAELQELVVEKTRSERVLDEDTSKTQFLTPEGILTGLSYFDDEGDLVHVESDKDLEEAIMMGHKMNKSRLVIFFGTPSPASNLDSATNSKTDSMWNSYSTVPIIGATLAVAILAAFAILKK